MTSKYAIALYELICLRANREHCVEAFSYAQFRDLLGVPPGTYERGLDFQRKVVDPAILEVNGLSDMSVNLELRRKHARAPISEVAISWWRKSASEFRKQSRSGTAARWVAWRAQRNSGGGAARACCRDGSIVELRGPLAVPPAAV